MARKTNSQSLRSSPRNRANRNQDLKFLTSTTMCMAGLTLKFILKRMKSWRHRKTDSKVKLAPHKLSYPSLSSKKTPIDSSSCRFSTTTYGRCTRTKWHASGLSTRLTSERTQKTGQSSKTEKSISSSMFLPSSLPQMVLYSRTLPPDSWLKSKFQRPGASTAFKWWWRTSTLKPTQFWSIPTLKMLKKKIFCSKLSTTFQVCRWKPSGPSSGSNPRHVSPNASSVSQPSRVSSSLAASALSSGSKREVWCRDSPSQTN